MHPNALAGADPLGRVGDAHDRGDAVLARDDRAVGDEPANLCHQPCGVNEERCSAGIGMRSDEDLIGGSSAGQPVRKNVERGGGDAETARDWEAGAGHPAEVYALAADARPRAGLTP